MSYPVRPDPSSGKRLLRAGVLFAVAMLCVLVSLAWTITSNHGKPKRTPAGRPQSLSVCGSLVLVFAAVPYVMYARLRIGARFRCPQCGERTKSPATRGPIHHPGRLAVGMSGSPVQSSSPRGTPIRHDCDRCRVTWDTGWKVGRLTPTG